MKNNGEFDLKSYQLFLSWSKLQDGMRNFNHIKYNFSYSDLYETIHEKGALNHY